MGYQIVNTITTGLRGFFEVMKLVEKNSLVKLSPHALDLIALGIYSLYVTKINYPPYLVRTDKDERYFLDVNGLVLDFCILGNLMDIVEDAVCLN